MTIADFFVSNSVSGISPELIDAFDTLGQALMRVAISLAPNPALPLVLTPLAVKIAAPHPPPPPGAAFINLIAADITKFILIPLTLGSVNIKTPAAVGLPALPISPATATAALAMLPPNPSFMKAVLQWAVSLVPVGDLRVPGGFIII
jgi:hypothetical protein